MKYRKLLVSGCSFSAGSSSLDEVKQNPETWSHYLVNNDLTDIDVLINVALTGGGNAAMVNNLIYAIETQNTGVIDPAETLVIFNVTGLQRIDMISETFHPNANKYHSWDTILGFNWITIPHLTATNTVFKDLIHKNCGYDNIVLYNSLQVIMLINYLESKGFAYKFMLLDDTIEEEAPDILLPYIANAIKFEGLNMHEYCKENNMLSEDGWHPSDTGYKSISDMLYQALAS
jgi:hypothetical protein